MIIPEPPSEEDEPVEKRPKSNKVKESSLLNPDEGVSYVNPKGEVLAGPVYAEQHLHMSKSGYNKISNIRDPQI